MVAQQGKGRKWIVWNDESFDSDAEFRAAVEQELVDIYPMAHRGGRGVVVAPVREQLENGTYVTTGFVFEEVFMPAARRAAEAPLEAPAEDEMATSDREPVEA